jgi:DNA polymerase I-like protein with 3'-5' exonuclease and polymerase domains
MERFQKAYPGYAKLKNEIIPSDVRNGYFTGFDGRIVFCDSAHKMPAGYLQTGETVVMKLACQIWQERLKKEKINYKLVNDVHDEWQTEVDNDEELCQYVSEVQADSIRIAGEELNLNCPMKGSIKKPGLTWYDTH